jgi:hypothetical protein
MDTNKVLSDLRAERNRIDQAISALEALDGTGTLTAAPKAKSAQPRGIRKGITTAGRKRLSELAKARWAARRRGAKTLQPKKAGAHKPMSAATKRKLSLRAKARWAQRKKAAKAS